MILAWFRRWHALIVLAACLLSQPVHAHLMPAGQGSVRLVGDSAYVVMAFPVALLAGVDENHDGLANVAEIDNHRAAIGEQVTNRLQLLADGVPGNLVFEDFLISHASEIGERGADTIAVVRRYQWQAQVQSFAIRATIFEPGKEQLLVRALKGDLNEVAILTPDRAEFRFFAGAWDAFTRFVALGAEHILIGADHLLFLLTVLVAGAGWRYWLAVVTAFTVAHSVTLVLSVFGIVQAPAHIIEPLIAASIVLLAIDNLLRKQAHFRHRVVLVFACGLLHGLGIASVLAAFPISGHHLAASLLGFNIGVEAGQIVFVALALASLGLLRRFVPPDWHARTMRAGSLVAAFVGAFWLFERIWF